MDSLLHVAPMHARMVVQSTDPRREGNDLSIFACVRPIFPSVLDDIFILSSYSPSIHPVLLESSAHRPPIQPHPPLWVCSLILHLFWAKSESHHINLQQTSALPFMVLIKSRKSRNSLIRAKELY